MTTKEQLEQLCKVINNATNNKHNFAIGTGYGKVRLESKGGAVNVSPLLSKKDLYNWMQAFLSGIELKS